MCNPDVTMQKGKMNGDSRRQSQRTFYDTASNGHHYGSPVKNNSSFASWCGSKHELRLPSWIVSTMEFGLGSTIAFLTLAFSLWFPFVMAPHAAKETYHAASYTYDKNYSLFDNTVWTYMTDYALLIIMGWLSLYIHKSQSTKKLRRCSASLLGLYAVSVMAGGFAHQFYLTVESRNTWHFRACWTLCVGTVSLAGGIMGLCGSQLARGFSHVPSLYKLPVVPEWFWIGFGVFQAIACAMGSISYQRPACDIFIAGTTQFPSTFYVILAVWLHNWENETRRSYRMFSYIGFLWNAPLLPMYPLLVQYTDWSLASVNTLLHCWLLVGWSLQGVSLLHFCNAIHKQQEKIRKSK